MEEEELSRKGDQSWKTRAEKGGFGSVTAWVLGVLRAQQQQGEAGMHSRVCLDGALVSL